MLEEGDILMMGCTFREHVPSRLYFLEGGRYCGKQHENKIVEDALYINYCAEDRLVAQLSWP